jgi:16S rRNA (uracil1498-N3)-methyltransferase
VVELSGSEAHHLGRVLRLKPGQQVVLFDGRGAEATAEIMTVTRHTAELRVLSTHSEVADATAEIILATAVPKGDRLRWLVEKATELGVSRFVPLITQHSVVEPGDGKLDKLQQTVIAACKQSGRNTLMTVDAPIQWGEFIGGQCAGRLTLIAHPSGATPSGSQCEVESPINLVVGPEGGWTESEIEQGKAAGAHLISLGPHILRIETAAVALVSWVVVSRAALA